MSPAEAQLLAHYREWIMRAGFAPTQAEAARHFGVSVSCINDRIKKLERDGHIVRRHWQRGGVELAGVVSLVGVPSDALRAELARRGETLDALDGGERPRLGGARRFGGGSGSCAAPGCQLEVQRGHLMCLSHWRALPETLRHSILATHRRARELRCPEATRRFGQLVAEARDLLDRRCAGPLGERN